MQNVFTFLLLESTRLCVPLRLGSIGAKSLHSLFWISATHSVLLKMHVDVVE